MCRDRAQVQNSDTYIFDIGDDDEDSTQGAYSIDANTSGMSLNSFPVEPAQCSMTGLRKLDAVC